MTKSIPWKDRVAQGKKIKADLRAELECRYKTKDHPNAGKLWDLAWEYGHAYGVTDVEHYYCDLSELLK